MTIIAEAINTGNCPQHVQLSLQHNQISNNGIITLLNSMKLAQQKTAVWLDVSHNHIKNKGALAIAAAIEHGYWPLDKILDVSSNNIGNTGATAITAAILSTECSPGFQLNLCANQIDDSGTAGIAGILTTRPHPRDLSIDITEIRLTNAGVKHFADALNGARCAPGLTIDYKNELINPDWKPKINALMIKNHMRHTNVLGCLAFLQGSRQPGNIVSKLSRDILIMICAETYPFQQSAQTNGQSPKKCFADRVFAFFRAIKNPEKQKQITPGVPLLKY
jgi:hypothetical protein